MNAIDNGKIQENDISLGTLLDMLAGQKDAPLIFYYDGEPVKSGYHITESRRANSRVSIAAPIPRLGRRSSSSSGISRKATASTCRPASSARSSAR
ncbi:hypothetical protein GGE68_001031 [Rhizobium leguminosarum]|nr:hypothetical protein [Rhizobium leguminosarum]